MEGEKDGEILSDTELRRWSTDEAGNALLLCTSQESTLAFAQFKLVMVPLCNTPSYSGGQAKACSPSAKVNRRSLLPAPIRSCIDMPIPQGQGPQGSG